MNRTVSISLDDDDDFFDPCDRLSSVVALDLGSASDDNDEFFEASRMSFARNASIRAASIKRVYSIAPLKTDSPAYDMWIAEPGDVNERRQRLLQGMGLVSSKNLVRLATSKVARTPPIKPPTAPTPAASTPAQDSPAPPLNDQVSKEPVPQVTVAVPMRAIVLVRSRSDGDIDVFSTKTKKRKEEIMGTVSKSRITRRLSGQLKHSTTGACHYSGATIRVVQEGEKAAPKAGKSGGGSQCVVSDTAFPSFFLIKNLDTGSDFIVKEFNEEGMWDKVNDLQTGKQLSMDEFEKSVGHSPVVKELMRRMSRNMRKENSRKNSHFTKSFRSSTKKGTALLKNLRVAASGFLVVEKGEKAEKEEKEEEDPPPAAAAAGEEKSEKHSSQWVDAHQHGKQYKEFTALHFSQEIQAHEGSIWTMKFSSDARLLATAGEDTNIHVWEVHEFEIMQPKPPEEYSSSDQTDAAGTSCDRVALADVATLPIERKKGKKTAKGAAIPEYVKLPETVVSISEKPKYSLKGHKDEVLDLSWSQSQQLLSSSMDKTVRLWDLETQSCLKIFAHSDYVTSIQFNPVADNHFISGSLDGKLRIWSVADRQVVDWTDVHEMVTAASYTPDGQGAIVGSQQGNCKMYSVEDSTLEHRMDIQKKKKPPAKKFPAFASQSKKLTGFQTPAPAGKITGFQFAPWSPSEVLISSADSRLGIYNGPDLVQKIRGFRNTSSQISASFCPDGKHVISAGEDSQVYVWKVEEAKNTAPAKKKTIVEVGAHEYFTCKDVSVAITWPGSTKFEAPTVDFRSKKSTKRPPPPPQEEDASAAACTANGCSLPPLPKKKKEGAEERTSCAEDQVDSVPTDQGVETSDSVGEGEEPSASGGGGNIVQATTWGLVIIAASLEGEIRVYQNLGLPLKVARLF